VLFILNLSAAVAAIINKAIDISSIITSKEQYLLYFL